jgi:D-alanyl-lipoteichoic acid acyltransferase DltB (MBOAT superfamily)
MLFNSTQFAMFLPVAVAGFWFLPFGFRKWWLLGISYIFYMGTVPKVTTLLFLVTVIHYLTGLWLDRWPGKRRLGIWISVATNLGILAYFKYANFLLDSWANLVRMLGGAREFDALAILLPVGISFYIFIGMSYSIDCYRGKFKPVRDFSLFACFLSFFPQLLAGPIVRAGQLIPQLRTSAPFRRDLFEEGLRLLMLGLFKKVLLADKLAPIANRGFADIPNLTGVDAWVSALAFTFQIYFDFSGYTDMARGSAKLFGIELPENFRLPYLARNPREFWRRWHITLSTWLRDYLYISLGGNRRSKHRLYTNLMITMALGGLWHGAAWTFFIWGVYHGLLLVIHRKFLEFCEAVPSLEGFLETRLGEAVSVATTFLLVTLGWVFFRADTFQDALSLFAAMACSLRAGPVTETFLDSHVPIFAACLVLYHGLRVSLRRFAGFYPFLRRMWTYTALSCLLLAIVYFTNYYPGKAEEHPEPFIYFQF